MELHVFAQDAEDASSQLREAEFARSLIVAVGALFMLVGFVQTLGIAVVLGMLALSAGMWWHFVEVPKARKINAVAKAKYMAVLFGGQSGQFHSQRSE